MVITAEDYACLAEYHVVLAWLADPETCPCQLRAQVCDTHLEIHGTVPSQKVRARVLQLAGLNSGKATIDSLSVMPAFAAPKQRPGAESPEHLRAMCQQALDEGAGKVVFDLHLDVDGNGCVTVQGTIPSFEEKLVVSQRLRRVPGCACVRNNLTIWNIMDVGKPYVLVTANGSHLVPLESVPTMRTVAAAEVPVKDVLPMKGAASAPGVSSSTSRLSRPFAGLFQKIIAPAKTPAASAPVAVDSAPPTAPAKPPAMPTPAPAASVPMPNPIDSAAPPQVTPPTSASAVKPASVLAERDRLAAAKAVARGLNPPMAPVAKPRNRAPASGDIYISPHVALRTEAPRRGTVPVPPEIGRAHCRTAGTQGAIVTLPVMASRMPLPPADQAVRPLMQTDVATKTTAPSVTAPSVASVAPAPPTLPAAGGARTPTTIVQSSFETPPPVPDDGIAAPCPNPIASQPESVPPESSPPEAPPTPDVEAAVSAQYPVDQPQSALPESAPPAPLAEAAAPMQLQPEQDAADQPESARPDLAPPAPLAEAVAPVQIQPEQHAAGQAESARLESAPPAPLAEAAAPVQLQYAIVVQPQAVPEEASQPSAPLPVPAAYASASPVTTSRLCKEKPATATTGPVSAGVIVMASSQDEPVSVAGAAVQLQAWLRHVVVDTCGSDAEDVQLQLHSCSEIALKVRTSEPALARSLAERIMRLPALIPYRVALEIQVKNQVKK